MTEQAFTHHRPAALALLQTFQNLSHKEAGFLGNLCVARVITDRQRDWLARLLKRNGLPPLVAGEGP